MSKVQDAAFELSIAFERGFTEGYKAGVKNATQTSWGQPCGRCSKTDRERIVRIESALVRLDETAPKHINQVAWDVLREELGRAIR